MKLESKGGNAPAMGLLGTLSEQGLRVVGASLEPWNAPDSAPEVKLESGLLKRLKVFAVRSGRKASGRVGRLMRGSRSSPNEAGEPCEVELTLPWLVCDQPKDSAGYQALVAEQEALKMLCKALKLIQYGAQGPYARAATGMLEQQVQGLAALEWVLGDDHEALERIISEGGENARGIIAQMLDAWAQKAHSVIRDTYARVPMVEGDVEQTWLGLANSHERLCNLRTALETIRDSDLPWTTTLTAAKLLNELVRGISLEHWSEQDRAAVYWLGRADQAQKQAAAHELGLWADEAFRFLDRAVAKHGLGFI